MTAAGPTGVSYAAILVAAGRSTRMGSDKLWAELWGRPVWRWSLDTLLADPALRHIAIAVPPNAIERFRAALPSDDERCLVIAGGDVRADSVIAGLWALTGVGHDDRALVLVHDAARPAVTPELVRSVVCRRGRDRRSGRPGRARGRLAEAGARRACRRPGRARRGDGRSDTAGGATRRPSRCDRGGPRLGSPDHRRRWRPGRGRCAGSRRRRRRGEPEADRAERPARAAGRAGQPSDRRHGEWGGKGRIEDRHRVRCASTRPRTRDAPGRDRLPGRGTRPGGSLGWRCGPPCPDRCAARRGKSR